MYIVFSIAIEHSLKVGACEISSLSSLWKKGGYRSFMGIIDHLKVIGQNQWLEHHTRNIGNS